jgi:5-methyltetrahydrofolate--homocysteine methyltransferase
MDTTVSSEKQAIVVSDKGPTVLIGERINPSGKKKLMEALKNNDLAYVVSEAVAQVEAGADILDVNVVAPGVDEVTVLPKVIQAVMESVHAPLCIDINKPEALKEALKGYRGKPVVNSVTGEEKSLHEILPVVKEYNAAVIGLTIDDDGIPKDPGKRVSIANKIVERAESVGIPREDVIIDCLCLTLGADSGAALVTLEAIRRVKEELGLNQTLGASNISFGLPDRTLVNNAFLAIAIMAGVTCPTVDVAKVRAAVLSADLILGRDRFAQRYIRGFRDREKMHSSKKS